MSTSNLQALTLLLDRAVSERDEALRALRDAQNQAEQARNQHGQLAQYRNDYQQRWTQTFAQRTTVDILGCYQTFGLRLDQAINQQDQVSSYAEQRQELARNRLADCELRVASIRKLIERRRQDGLRVALRQEQKATDEQAARAALAGFGAYARVSA